jgi:hypothetical protein
MSRSPGVVCFNGDRRPPLLAGAFDDESEGAYDGSVFLEVVDTPAALWSVAEVG